ncbi:Oxygen-dependent choline dehydrogenase [Arenibacter antarcticus]|uniref:Lycopene cyclase family protein n=1 Tax=Arenibacter antarcticus TaxID=2040469 RepID=A0ABW5V9T1_9FLAO|nr:lycopene cyclase family protein [Arenibacter sp. H213]MCM4168031.1 lycopene cyclase [Arenibacter sp. H213]
MTTYDYIIVGAGASGLMLADALGRDVFFSKKSILLLEKDNKQKNDRTWCFWETGEGSFNSVLHKSWNRIFFAGEVYSEQLNLSPYAYKMVRGEDFYDTYLKRLKTYPNISFALGTVTDIQNKNALVQITTATTIYHAKKVFNSVFDYKKLLEQKKYPVLQQHFLGWFIKTEHPLFDVDQATFMDFSIPQKGNTRFMYVLPTSTTEALIEYTLFSKEVLSVAAYEEGLKTYIKDHLGCENYVITNHEKGNIPMSCFNFNAYNSPNILHIGISGGWAKPSSGYTFMHSYKKVQQLIPFLKKDLPLDRFNKKNRFWFYDLLLLDILDKENSKGRLIFEQLFKNQRPQNIFKFLDEETSFWEDLQIIAACPKKEFISALLRRIFKI